MKSVWDRRIERALNLAQSCPPAGELLTYYARLAALQKSIYENFAAHPNADPLSVADYFEQLRALGPAAVAPFPKSSVASLLVNHWRHEAPDDDIARFIARALLQPFAEALAARGVPPGDASSGTCPFCGGLPFCALLRGEGEGGKRRLVCGLCATEWESRRIFCPQCGQDNREQLPVYIAPEFDYIRVEACDSCNTYLKCVDLTRNGLAVAAADELASVALNVWAEEHDYTKLEPNVLGM